MPHTIHNPHHALAQARVVWAVFVAGVIAMTAIGVFMARAADPYEPHGDTHADFIVLVVSIAAVIVLIPLGLFLRGQTFKRGWVGDAVTPSAYLGGCVVAWAMADAAAVFGVGGMIMSQRVMPNVLPTAVSLLLLIAMWPNGRAMFPPHDPHGSGAGRGPVNER
jgi:hypothetical protein